MVNLTQRNMGHGGGSGGTKGPWLQWLPDGNATWNVPFKSFALRGVDPGSLSEMSRLITHGDETAGRAMLLDIHNIRTGWQCFVKRRPHTKWGDPSTPLDVGPRPDPIGVDEKGAPIGWDSCFLLPVLTRPKSTRAGNWKDGGVVAASWHQSSKGAVTGFERLIDALVATGQDTSDPNIVPAVVLRNVEQVDGFRVTWAPLLHVVAWVPRPDALPNEDWSGTGDEYVFAKGQGEKRVTGGEASSGFTNSKPRHANQGALDAAMAAQAPNDGTATGNTKAGAANNTSIIEDEIPF